MSATLTELPEYVELWIQCSGCDGKGEVEEHSQVIAEHAMPKHLKEHAYTTDEDRNWIGANCDCPRVPVVKKRQCINCVGSGEKLARLAIPKKGSKVNVIDRKLLTSIFGKGNEPDTPGSVYDVQLPNQHHLELKTGIGVRVTWDRLNKDGSIPKKSKNVVLWTFDLTEVRPA